MMNYSKKPPKRTPKTARLRLRTGPFQADLTIEDLITLTGCARRTAQTWRRNPAKLPPHVRELLEIKVFGLIPGLDQVRIVDGRVTLTNGQQFSTGNLYAITYALQELAILRTRTREQKQRIEDLHAALDHWRAVAGAPIAQNDA